MTKLTVLVRGVNVGRGNRLAMGDFRGVLTDLGCTQVKTYLQSGNAVVDSPVPDLGRRVEKALTKNLGLDVRVLTRTAAELAEVVAANPFPEKESSPKLLHVAFLETQPDPALVEEVGIRHGQDEMAVGDHVIYLSFTKNSHESPLIKPLKAVGGVATARNWTTVTKLADMAHSA